MPLPRILSRLARALRSSRPVRFIATGGLGWELPASMEGRREAAHWAYRTILLREPEADAAVEHLARHSASAKAMRDTLIQSEEARQQHGFPVTVSLTGNEPAQHVQTEVQASDRDRLFNRVQETWHALGREQPHWSVSTNEAFRPENIERSLDEFYASGEANVETLLRTLRRNGIDPARLRRCMDFGAGVGRLSAALAKRFERVIAVDVSASHLEVARKALGERGIGNVETRLLESIEAVDELPPVDLVYSLIVLQHNPPPVIRELLSRLLGRLDPGGVAVVQVPTYLPAGYRFDAEAYLAQRSTGIEMHALPQRDVFAVARERGVEVLEVLEDAWTGYGPGSRSNTFVMQRPA